jgi:hypothetical protein
MALVGGPPEFKREDPFMFEAGWSAANAPNLAVYNGSSPHHLTLQTCVLAGDSAASRSSDGAAAEAGRDSGN